MSVYSAITVVVNLRISGTRIERTVRMTDWDYIQVEEFHVCFGNVTYYVCKTKPSNIALSPPL